MKRVSLILALAVAGGFSTQAASAQTLKRVNDRGMPPGHFSMKIPGHFSTQIYNLRVFSSQGFGECIRYIDDRRRA